MVISRLIVACIAPFFIHKFDPRKGFTFGSIITALAMYTIGGYFHFKVIYPEIAKKYSWIPLICLAVPYQMTLTGLVIPIIFGLLGKKLRSKEK